MTTDAASTSAIERRASMGRKLIAGVIGGIAGGLVFGVLMSMMGMMGMIASLMGSDSAGVGFAIHLMISIIFGVAFVVLASRFVTTWGLSLIAGAVWGVITWVIGPLVIMPLMMGMPLFMIDSMALLSLMGHVLYGLVLGAVTFAIIRRRA